MLKLQEMIKAPYVFACAKDFNFLCDRCQQVGILKPTKNDQASKLVILEVLDMIRVSH